MHKKVPTFLIVFMAGVIVLCGLSVVANLVPLQVLADGSVQYGSGGSSW